MLGGNHPVIIWLERWHLLALRQTSAKRYALVVAFVSFLFVTTLAWPQSCTPDFVITPTPNGPQHNRLRGVVAFDVNDVWAVGFTNGTNDQTLTEHWDGSSWTIVSSPNQDAFSALSAVGGIATNDLWAVGSFHATPGFHPDQTLTEHWDGICPRCGHSKGRLQTCRSHPAQWSIVPSPNLQGFDLLNAVAAVATDDVWAVGEDSLPNPLFMHWDGQTWTLVDPPPDAGPQIAVAALASNDVWSAGSGRSSDNTGLFNHWDGTSWTTIPNPPITPGSVTIRALSALAPNDIWAAGSLFFESCDDTCFDSETVTVLHWDGQSWSMVRAPMASIWARLTGIAAQSSASVWAVGFENAQTLASHWDGTRWTNAPNIQLGAGTFFEGVSVAGGDAWAVGWSAFPGKDQTLAVRYRCD